MKCIVLHYIAVSAVLAWSCTTRQPTAEKPVAQSTASQLASKAVATPHPRATVPEVEAALNRVFGDAVVSDRRQHWFATGDFNGDGSDDLAVLVRPSSSQKLAVINDPLANWTLQDATNAFFPPSHARVVVLPPKPKPQRVTADEILIAVIHGFGKEGWRDRQARQAYLVRHAGTAPMRAVPAPGHVDGAPASLMRSDVILEKGGRTGFLFWTGSQYAWRPVQTNDRNRMTEKIGN